MMSPQTSLTWMQFHCTSILPGSTAINSIFPATYHNSSNHCFQLKMLTYISLLMWLMLHKSNQLPTTNSATSIQFQFYYSCNLTPAFTWSKLASFAAEFGNPASNAALKCDKAIYKALVLYSDVLLFGVLKTYYETLKSLKNCNLQLSSWINAFTAYQNARTDLNMVTCSTCRRYGLKDQ